MVRSCRQMTALGVDGREEGNAGVGCVCVWSEGGREEGPALTGLIYIPSKKKRKEKERTGKEKTLTYATDPGLTTHVRSDADADIDISARARVYEK